MESKFTNTMETINEVVTVLVVYTIMCFTAFVPDPTTRRLVGFAQIGVICLYMGMHLIMMLAEQLKKLYWWIRRRHITNKRKKVQQALLDAKLKR